MTDSTNYIQKFEYYLVNTKKMSANTCSSYVRDISQFDNYLTSNTDVDLLNVTQLQISEYVDWMQRHRKASASISRSISSLKCFYSFLLINDVVYQNPVHDLNLTKSEKKLPQILTDSEVDLLLHQPQCIDPKGYRDYAMLELLYATGIRVSEMVALNMEDVFISAGVIKCSKNHKERIIPIHSDAIQAVRDYVHYGRRGMVTSENEHALFVNRNGDRMSRQGFWKVVKHYQEMANINKDITPHTLRHSFAAHLLENGTDLRSIQDMMGHADVSSTQIYTHLVPNHLKDIYSYSHTNSQV